MLISVFNTINPYKKKVEKMRHQAPNANLTTILEQIDDPMVKEACLSVITRVYGPETNPHIVYASS